MAITKKQNQKLRKILENVKSLLSDISELGCDGDIRHTDIKFGLFVVSDKELGRIDEKIDKIYSSLEKIISELEEADGKA